MIRSLVLAALLASAAPAAALPDFVSKPSDAYDGYVALRMPRTEVPVGALWVQDYGPTGAGASADNLVTERSLSQVTINSELQLSLTAGLLNFLGLDPSLKNRLTARFGELSLVRVKEMTALAGPSGEPRIYEAIKAGQITITTDNDLGLRIETRVYTQNLPVTGRSENGKRRSFSIDGKDMFIAYRVATLRTVRRESDVVRLKRVGSGWRGTSNGRDFILETDGGACGPAGSFLTAHGQGVLPPDPDTLGAASGASLTGQADTPAASMPAPSTSASGSSSDAREPDRPVVSADAENPSSMAEEATLTQALSFPLRVPIADGKGGMLDRALVHVRHAGRGSSSAPASLCSAQDRELEAEVTLTGSRLEEFREPRAPRW